MSHPLDKKLNFILYKKCVNAVVHIMSHPYFLCVLNIVFTTLFPVKDRAGFRMQDEYSEVHLSSKLPHTGYLNCPIVYPMYDIPCF